MKLGKSNENITVLCPVSEKKRQRKTQNNTLGTYNASSVISTCTGVLEEYSSEEQEIIDEFHRTLVPFRFLPINQFSEKVRDVLVHRSLNEWRSFFGKVAADPSTWPTRRTLVNLAWDNY